jgi:hypothetical protein
MAPELDGSNAQKLIHELVGMASGNSMTLEVAATRHVFSVEHF